MNITAQIAKHFREIYFGDNWTASNLKDNLKDITWEQSTMQVYSLNSIATLVYHMNYYVIAVIAVLQGHQLDAHDKYSFNAPPIKGEDDWIKLLDKTFADAETCASLIEQLPDGALDQTFSNEKYGNYYRNLSGVIENNHYHLGQIALLKKIILQAE